MACELNEVSAVYKYLLDKSSRKYKCPKCNKKRFVVYMDMQENKIISELVGRCDREVNCGYHYSPKLFFKNNNFEYTPLINNSYKPEKKETTFHSISLLKQSLIGNVNNNFINYLKTVFDTEKVENITRLYRIGTATFWNNATIFWQIDSQGKIRSGKMINYSKNGKRSKYVNWVHSYQLKNNLTKEFNLNQCLFGLHLINQSKKAIAIVESEKTACIMSQVFDKYIWLASGSLNNLNENKLHQIKDRKIILYPDLGPKESDNKPYNQWKKKSDYLSRKGYDIGISDLLENKATEEQKSHGYDIADYFLDVPNKTLIKNDITTENINKLLVKNGQLQNLIEVFDLEILSN
ncbi:DUF6371 domain-containing protein [Zobellia barbeyronii]|uniref:DNA primase n=1 Tax=Zobellia barbeyronii TaxID=2748009 RepID=A0ABS5WEA5_9FLAO|nr:DUF6371 domain-containing protein [Zobellia barbeyronii]MBT2161293.1 hypothetical protein [Zobellia barbeyronii]